VHVNVPDLDWLHVVLAALLIVVILVKLRTSHRRRFGLTFTIERTTLDTAETEQKRENSGGHHRGGRTGRADRSGGRWRFAAGRLLAPTDDDDHDTTDVHDDHDHPAGDDHHDDATPGRRRHDDDQHQLDVDHHQLDVDHHDDDDPGDDLNLVQQLHDGADDHVNVLNDPQLHQHVDNVIEHGPGEHDYGPQFDDDDGREPIDGSGDHHDDGRPDDHDDDDPNTDAATPRDPLTGEPT
jgi:hypothetical protein